MPLGCVRRDNGLYRHEFDIVVPDIRDDAPAECVNADMVKRHRLPRWSTPLAIASLLTTAAACNRAQDDCEHARDVVVAHAKAEVERLLEHAPSAEAPGLMERANAEIAQIESAFAERCAALDEAGRACVARIDELQQVRADLRAAEDACAGTESGRARRECSKKARDEADAKLGGCTQTLRALTTLSRADAE